MTRSGDGGTRARVVAAVVGALGIGSFAVTLAVQVGVPANASVCGPEGELMDLGRGPAVCVHRDVPPPGVDLDERATTAELLDRPGAGLRAYEAAEELGVPMAVESNATTPAVTCDGDGTSGFRVQAMYVVEAGQTNRYATLLPSLKLWAAGVDDVFNRSAALTGGVRNVRYVTEAGAGGTCEAKVLNVTVPAGSMTSFNATIAAVQALGHTSTARKYLMWADTSGKGICGIATMYPHDVETQDNRNNGLYAQYSRIDNPCWGWGNGTNQHSVEAHELSHNLGSVQSTAPHKTTNGHCYDESDTMCYADGSGIPMQQVCPTDREYLLDCNSDDYYSTFPDPGSYLDTHWNTADSRFLIGGGDGAGGGTAGTPTVLGATIGVNNPAVPGLRTQVEVTPVLPAGRTITSVTWKSARADCVFTTPRELQSDVTCNASATGSTTVTATLVDSTGATKTVSSPLTFAAASSRPVTVALSIAGQSSGATASVCTGAAFPVAATVTDTASGLPVKGLTVSFTKKTATMTAPGSAGSGVTTYAGAATLNQSTSVATTYAARSAATAAYQTALSASRQAVPGQCATDLTTQADRDAVYYGEPVRVSGTLTRVVGGVTVPVAGASLPVRVTSVSGGNTRVVTLGTAKTLADGTYALAVKPTTSGTLSVSLVASAGYAARSASLGAISVHLPTTDLDAAVDRTDVGYGSPVVISGRLTRTAGALTTGEVTSGVASATVSVRIQAPGKTAAVVASGRTAADGTFRISAPVRLSGALSVGYAGGPGLPAASVALGNVTAGTWTPSITLVRGTTTATTQGLSGTVTRTYGGLTEPAKSLAVKLYWTPTGGTAALLKTVYTATAGTFSTSVPLRSGGTYTAVVSGVLGYTSTTSNALAR